MSMNRLRTSIAEAARLWPRYRRQAARETLRVVIGVNALIVLIYMKFGWERVVTEIAISSLIALTVGIPIVINRGVQQARLEVMADELRRLAHTDPLTGLANRRAMMDALAALQEAPRAAFACFDIDRFKGINDTFGHGGGDAVIRSFAALLAARLPQGAIAARLGGEEFGVLFADGGLDDALAFAEQITRLTRLTPARAPNGLPVMFTVSAGCSAAADSGERLALAADEALYRAKRAGRDRVVSAA
jgi:diguanylate cyclase (GGDEF)-like protein